MNVLMPQLGETVAEGTVSVWHKQVGDTVETDEILLDVETDKVSMEIPSPGRGVLAEIKVPAGETVEVGTVLAVIAAEGAAAAPTQREAGAGPQSPAPSNDDAAPSNRDARPQAPDPSYRDARPQSPDPSNRDVVGAASRPRSPQRSDLTPASHAAASNPAATGDPPAAKPPPGHPPQAETGKVIGRSEHQRLSPAVRRLAAENRLDLTVIAGSGRHGRITRRDVVSFIAARGPGSAATAGRAGGRPAPAAAHADTSGNVVPFSRVRRLTAEHMVRSKATSAHVLQAVEVDFQRVDSVRKAMRDAWRSRHGHSLTYLPFIAKAVCQALTEFPNLNARVEGDGLRLSEQVNLGIAIDLGPEGLVAPVLKSAEQLSVGELSTAIAELSRRARDHRLKPDDLSGGTYTITNNGSFGTLITAPIINQPQVAILSSDGVRKKPVVIEHPDGDSLAIRPIGILAQSFDHRAVDGAYSAAFLDRVRKLLEQTAWSVDL